MGIKQTALVIFVGIFVLLVFNTFILLTLISLE